jgi:cellobiose transport system substrate-binding protein
VTLDVSLFGAMGFEEAGLLDQYEQDNPGVTINYESTQEEADYWTACRPACAPATCRTWWGSRSGASPT